MRDGGVGEEAFDVVLYERADVAQGHGERGRDPEQPEAARGVGLEEHAQQDGKGSGLGAGGHQANDGSGRAFVDVGRPDVERSGGNFEAEAHKHQGDCYVGE